MMVNDGDDDDDDDAYQLMFATDSSCQPALTFVSEKKCFSSDSKILVTLARHSIESSDAMHMFTVKDVVIVSAPRYQAFYLQRNFIPTSGRFQLAVSFLCFYVFFVHLLFYADFHVYILTVYLLPFA